MAEFKLGYLCGITSRSSSLFTGSLHKVYAGDIIPDISMPILSSDSQFVLMSCWPAA